jgi:hypothetical protein
MKLKTVQISKETQLIVECRAHLTSYDDFIFGLRVNQALYERQEQMFKQRLAELKAAYAEKVRQLAIMAENSGLRLELDPGMLMLEKGREAS